MTFGEKIQFLRKQKGMSQEQLASQLIVSRQAISKWELDSSMPDTDHVVQISELFEVSTDYLLKDGMEENTNNVPTQKDAKKDRFQIQPKTAFILSVGIVLMGLLASFIGWEMYQTSLAVGIGLMMQISGVIIFEVNCQKCNVRKRFYAISCWLISPFVVFFVAESIMRFYPRAYAPWIEYIIIGVLYLLVCVPISVQLVLRKKPIRACMTIE